jgi:putative ABC transport system substrate-binding protein
MNRRDTVFALLALGAASRVSHAQQQGKIWRVSYLSLRRGPNEFEQSFVRGMRERGYVDGTHIIIDYRWADGNLQRLQEMAAEVVASMPDVVVAPDGFGARDVRALKPAIPIVIPAMADPVASGYTRSMSHPDGNVTGVATLATELSRKRLELFKEALPGLQRVGALYNSNRPSPPIGVPATRAAGDALGVKVVEMRLALPEGIAAGFASAASQGVQGVVIISDTATISHRAPLCDAALSQRLPTIFANRTYLRAGGLMSYGADMEGAFHRSAYYVDRILKGARPADLPIEQPTRFELAVSLQTAKALGITIPQSLLLRADEVIQ